MEWQGGPHAPYRQGRPRYRHGHPESLASMAELVQAENNRRRERRSHAEVRAVPPEGRFQPPHPVLRAGPLDGRWAGFPAVAPAGGSLAPRSPPGRPGRSNVVL